MRMPLNFMRTLLSSALSVVRPNLPAAAIWSVVGRHPTDYSSGDEGRRMSDGVTCGQCGATAAPGQRFCGSCGVPLAVPCAACGTSNPPDHRFCGSCGSALGAGAGALALKPAAGNGTTTG